MAKKCGHCQSEVPGNAKVCRFCGATFVNMEDGGLGKIAGAFKGAIIGGIICVVLGIISAFNGGSFSDIFGGVGIGAFIGAFVGFSWNDNETIR